MEEGRLATRLLSEIGSARAAIAASYLNLWRNAGKMSPDDTGETRPRAHAEHAREPGPPAEPPDGEAE